MNMLSYSAQGLCVDAYWLALPNNYQFFAGIRDGKNVLFFFPRNSVATTQMATGREDDYDGSTDEEGENLTWASLPSGKTECIVFGEYHRQANHFL